MSSRRERNSNNRLFQMRTFILLTLACYFLSLVDSKSLAGDKSQSVITKHQEKQSLYYGSAEEDDVLNGVKNMNVHSRSKRSRSPPIWLIKCPNTDASCIPGSLYCPCPVTDHSDGNNDNYFSKLLRKLGF